MLTFQFIDFAKDLCQNLRNLGYWADYTDPVTGYPVLSASGGMLYSDVDACELLLK